ncbi:MAG: fumarate hydrolyase [Nitrospinae bacterium RIFCSPLOWO2_01_FULL_39_10]|nr:MAG: fumarate hydrolyase [Nitrospinae bacterium RIFCSPLOWO2_01_FULL_39_10]
MVILNSPISKNDVVKLKTGDTVHLNGIIVTARDVVHKYLIEKKPKEYKKLLKNGVLYHCGPVVDRVGKKWIIVAAGPTTSMRQEPYTAEVIKEYGVSGIIGKGGMGDRTLNALKKYKAVYFHAIGGLAQVLAECVVDVKDVFMLKEFGSPEAMWVLDVRDFPVTITMDSYGNSLHKTMYEKSGAVLKKIILKEGL